MSLPTYEDTYQDITDRLTSVLTSTTKVYRTQRLNRSNWENLVQNGDLVLPYIILETGQEAPATEFAAMDSEAYRLTVTAYYVAVLSPNAVVEVTELMQAARAALTGSPLTLSSLMGQMPTLDCTEHNPANAIFYELQSNRYAGMLAFDTIVGGGFYGG